MNTKVNTKVIVELETQQARSSLQDLQKALKAAKDEMVGLEPGSEAFLEAAKKAGELKHQIDDIRQAVNGASSDFGDIVGNVAKVGAGITGTFQAAQGAMSLFGVESENVTEAIKKMQNLMAMTQGLASIDQGIKAFGKLKTVIGLNSKALGGFKKALIGTGLGAFVILLGSIIANWEEFTKEIGLSQEQLNKFGEVFQGTINVILGSTKKIASAFAKVIKGDFSGAWEELKSGWDFQQMYAEGVEKAITDREKAELKKRQEEYQKYVDKRNAQLDTERSKAEATIKDETKLNKELVRIETERLKLYKKGSKEYYDQLKKIQDLEKANATKEKAERLVLDALSEQAKVRKQLQEQNLAEAQKIVEDKKTEIQLINEQIDRLKTAMSIDFENRKVYSKAILSLEEQRHQIVMENQAEEAQAARDAEQERLEKYSNAFGDFANNLDEMTDNPAWGKMVDHVINLTENWDTLSKEIKVGGEKSAKAYLQIFSQAFAGIGDMLTGLANEQDTSSRKGFETQKKMQIAATVMNMLSGIASAWSSAMQLGPIAGPIVGAVLTAATSALGGVQIAKIKQTKFDGGSVSGGAPNAALTASALAAAQPVQYTQDVQGASIEDTIKDQRVYVTESDISNTQHKVDVAESENRF